MTLALISLIPNLLCAILCILIVKALIEAVCGILGIAAGSACILAAVLLNVVAALCPDSKPER